jgi:peptide subunit release factor 1 (eRF1)
VVGIDDTRRALDIGQVDELLMSAVPNVVVTKTGGEPGSRADEAGDDGASKRRTPTAREQAVDELILKAHRTSARIRFIEDASLLADVGGVGAVLRFRL